MQKISTFLFSVLGYFFSITLFLVAFGLIFSGQIAVSMCLLLAGILIFPKFVDNVKKSYLHKNGKELPRFSLAIFSLIIFIIAILITPKSSNKLENKTAENTNKTQSTSQETKNSDQNTQKSNQNSENSVKNLVENSQNSMEDEKKQNQEKIINQQKEIDKLKEQNLKNEQEKKDLEIQNEKNIQTKINKEKQTAYFDQTSKIAGEVSESLDFISQFLKSNSNSLLWTDSQKINLAVEMTKIKENYNLAKTIQPTPGSEEINNIFVSGLKDYNDSMDSMTLGIDNSSTKKILEATEFMKSGTQKINTAKEKLDIFISSQK